MTKQTPTFSIITTCKGRLDDLKQSLPRFMAQKDAEVIVVDYDCPDGAGDFVRAEYPGARLVSLSDRPKFNLPDARNIGAEHAQGDILVFLDADIVIANDLLETIEFPHQENVFGSFHGGQTNSLRGSSVVKRADFERIGGYDTLLSGYEGEDLDLYMRLKVIGLGKVNLGYAGIEKVIEQTDEQRLLYRRPNIKLQFLRGQLYQLAKEMAMRSQQMSCLDMPLRQKIMAQVDRQLPAVFKGEAEFKLTLNFNDRYKRGLLDEWEFSTSTVIRARKKPDV